MNPRTKVWVAGFVLALLSAFMQFTNVRETEQGGVVHGDGVKYVFYAYNLRHHGVFSHQKTFADAEGTTLAPDKLTLPGYPWFLSNFLGAGVPDDAFLKRVEFAQAALGVASTLLAFLIALRIVSLPWAFATGVLVATQPHLVVIGEYLLTEPLFMALALGATLALLHAAMPNGRPWQAAIAGVLMGLACLVRPQLAFVPLLLLLVAVLVPHARAMARQAIVGFVVFLAVVLPWHVRNLGIERAPGSPDLLVTSIYHGSFPDFMYRDDPRTRGYPHRFDPDNARKSEDMDAALAHVGALFRESPGRMLRWYLVGKPGAYLSWGMPEGGGDILIYPVTRSPWFERPLFQYVRLAHLLAHWPLMLAAIATMLVAFWRPAALARDPLRRRGIVLLASGMALMVFLHMLGLPLPRYNLPFKPLEFALAMAGSAAAWNALRARGGYRRAGASGSVVPPP